MNEDFREETARHHDHHADRLFGLQLLIIGIVVAGALFIERRDAWGATQFALCVIGIAIVTGISVYRNALYNKAARLRRDIRRGHVQPGGE